MQSRRSLLSIVFKWLTSSKDDKAPVPNRVEKSTVVYHMFDASAKKLKCEEILWVSDTCTKSHYRKQDEPNKSRKSFLSAMFDIRISSAMILYPNHDANSFAQMPI
jgi:hypothetical protein